MRMTAHFGGIGIGRLRGLLGATLLASLVAGCGWFDSTPALKVVPTRPGAERNVPAGSVQASSNGRQYDGDIRPVDESRSAPIGSVIPDKGGQKAQLDAAAKDSAERDSKARDAAAKRKADAEAPPPLIPGAEPAATPAGAVGPVTAEPIPPPPIPSTPTPPPTPGPQTSGPLPAPTPASPTATQ